MRSRSLVVVVVVVVVLLVLAPILVLLVLVLVLGWRLAWDQRFKGLWSTGFSGGHVVVKVNVLLFF